MNIKRHLIGKFLAAVLSVTCLQTGAGDLLTVRAQERALSTQSTISDGLTLPLAVDIALKTNPLMRATASGRGLADAQLTEAKAGRYPLLQVSENFARSNNPVFVFGSLLEQGKFTAQNFDLRSLNNPDSLSNFRTALTFRQPVLDQRQTTTRIARAEFTQQQADTHTSQAQQQLRFEVLRTFYGVLLAYAHKEVADEAVKLAEADVKRTRDRVETGLAVVSDQLSSEVQLADFKQQQIEAEGEITTAIAALNTAMGLPVDTPQKISGALLEKRFDINAQNELIRLAIANRPDYERAGLGLRSSQQQVRGALGEMLPRVDVFTSYGFSSRNFSSGSGDYLVGASVTFNLFDAGRKARISQARAAESLAAADQERLASQIRFEVVRAHQQFLSARECLVVASRVISHATEALRIVRDRYNEGLTTITEVLRAETALVRAQMNVLAARYDHYIGYAGVLLVTGQLTDVQPFVG